MFQYFDFTFFKWSFFIAGIRNPMRYSCNLNPFFVILFYVYADL